MTFVVVASLLLSGASEAGGATPLLPTPPDPVVLAAQPEPGLSYGSCGDLPLPKTILFSASPEDIAADAEEWHRRGIEAFFLDDVARNWSSDIWARDGKPWTIGESDDTFQKAAEATAICRRIGSEVFLKVAFDQPFEWFNDVAWEQIYHNFRQYGLFAKATGCHGVALDIEYASDQYNFEWPGNDYTRYTRADLVEKVRERMTGIIGTLYDEFPDMIFLSFPEMNLGLGVVGQVAWIEEAARRNAAGGIHYCVEYTYRNPNVRNVFGHAWRNSDTFERLLSDTGKAYWSRKCSVAVGLWPFDYHEPASPEADISYEQFRQGYAASLMLTPHYNWIYSHLPSGALLGRDKTVPADRRDIDSFFRVLAAKEVVTTPEYVQLAREFRAMQPGDYSADLQLLPFPYFAVPRGMPETRLMPAGQCDPEGMRQNWDLLMPYFRGAIVNIAEVFATQDRWMVVGPFGQGEERNGHDTAFPPEESLDTAAGYDGMAGRIQWIEHKGGGTGGMVDLKQALGPAEHVCAYALCYVSSPAARKAQIRFGSNDSAKLWLGGQLLFDYPYTKMPFMDRDILPVTIPKGTTPILVKVCNEVKNWGFVLRITDEEGHPLPDLQYDVRKPD